MLSLIACSTDAAVASPKADTRPCPWEPFIILSSSVSREATAESRAMPTQSWLCAQSESVKGIFGEAAGLVRQSRLEQELVAARKQIAELSAALQELQKRVEKQQTPLSAAEMSEAETALAEVPWGTIGKLAFLGSRCLPTDELIAPKESWI